MGLSVSIHRTDAGRLLRQQVCRSSASIRLRNEGQMCQNPGPAGEPLDNEGFYEEPYPGPPDGVYFFEEVWNAFKRLASGVAASLEQPEIITLEEKRKHALALQKSRNHGPESKKNKWNLKNKPTI